MSKERNKYLPVYKKLGQNIRKAREMRGISQEELAFKVPTARNYLGCIERAEKFPALGKIYDIANALDTNLETLFKDI